MRTETIKLSVIEEISKTEVNANLPSIIILSEKYKCGRKIIQNAISGFEQANWIKLDKSSNGSTLLFKDTKALRQYYFSSGLKLALPPTIYYQTQDTTDIEQVILDYSKLDVRLYTTTSDSSDSRHKLIESNEAHIAVVTDSYFELSNLEDYTILEDIPIAHSSKLTYILNEVAGAYSVSERDITPTSLDNLPKTSTIKLKRPASYYFITKPHISHLLNDK